jgi:hypothetical protein
MKANEIMSCQNRTRRVQEISLILAHFTPLIEKKLLQWERNFL